MAYSTVAEVRLVLVGVDSSPATDYDLTANKLTDAQIEADIANADSQIDLALGQRYTIPFEVVPEIVRSLSIDIAAYLADLRFRGAREYGTELSPFVLRYQRAQQMLEKLSLGTLSLPGVDGSEGHSHVINPYEGNLMRTKHIFTRWPEGVISDG